jgi:hypothetical protein
MLSDSYYRCFWQRCTLCRHISDAATCLPYISDCSFCLEREHYKLANVGMQVGVLRSRKIYIGANESLAINMNSVISLGGSFNVDRRMKGLK